MSDTRRLAAIMFTDITGYTSMMGCDEDMAFNLLSRNRTIHQASIEKFNGTLIKEIGDGLLSCFSSASDAVRCAMEIQTACKKQNIPLKIGIHEGETVFTDNDIMGDAVNIASRLQESADPGNIIISSSVYNEIRNKTGFNPELIGDKQFKNISEPVRVYRVNCKVSENMQIQREKVSEDLQEKKSIIVLPFVNMSSDPEQEYFSDGLTEEIITDLSHIQNLLVISRNSAMTLKGTKLSTKEIAEKINARYVLEGSVRKFGNNLRITAQLIDGLKDVHIWAEKYNGTLDDIFDIQEKVSRNIMAALKLKFVPEEEKSISNYPIPEAKAHECYLKAKENIFLFTEEGIQRALTYLKKGLELVGENPLIYAGMGVAHFQLLNMGINQEKNLAKAKEYAQKAFNLDPESPQAHEVSGYISNLEGDMNEAIRHLNQAIHSDPSNAEATEFLAFFYMLIGKSSKARHLAELGITIDPLNPNSGLVDAVGYFFEGNFIKSKEKLSAVYNLAPESPMNILWYSLVLAYNKLFNEAQVTIGKALVSGKSGIWFLNIFKFFQYTLNKDKEKIDTLITAEFTEVIKRDLQLSYHAGCFYSYLNMNDQAFDWIENAINRGLINYPLLNEYDPFLENIRQDHRYKSLMNKVKLKWENFDA